MDKNFSEFLRFFATICGRDIKYHMTKLVFQIEMPESQNRNYKEADAVCIHIYCTKNWQIHVLYTKSILILK
jgi:hypothetical protein